jgi:hypothetical protein
MRGRIRTPLLLPGIMFVGSLCFGQHPEWHSPLPSPTQAVKLLEAVCPGSVRPTSRDQSPLYGCKPCPEFTTEGHPDSPMGRLQPFVMRTVIYGGFTAPGVKEAVADFEGCEPHAGGYGGSILFRKLRGSWSMVDYTAGLITSACQPYSLKTGRDLLLCEGEDHHMDEAWQGISVCDFSKQKMSRCRSVFTVLDTTVACGHSAVWSSINNAELHDLNGDGMRDITLWITLGQGTFPNPGGACVQTSFPPGRRYKLDFLFQQNTDSFVPAASSKALAEHLRAVFKVAREEAIKGVMPDSSR